MARRKALERLTWCSREQIESIAKAIGFDMSELPPDASPEDRARNLYDWATSLRGPGLLTLEASIPWSVDPEIARQFEVQGTAAKVATANEPATSPNSYAEPQKSIGGPGTWQ